MVADAGGDQAQEMAPRLTGMSVEQVTLVSRPAPKDDVQSWRLFAVGWQAVAEVQTEERRVKESLTAGRRRRWTGAAVATARRKDWES